MIGARTEDGHRMNPNELEYRTLLREDLDAARALMVSACSDIPHPIREPVEELIVGGGKRLRPALVLLSSRLYGADHQEALLTAASVELLHTATLIHDDLIDRAAVRRGVETINARWAPTASVLAGDIVFALAAKLIAQTNNTPLVQRFAEALETICTGELQQMFGRNGNLPSVDTYYRRIFAKTASLFSLCMESGPILTGAPEQESEQASQFGRLLGEAFQITDDVLDLLGAPQQLGKPIGSDLQQGLVTLPVLLYTQTVGDEALVQHALHHPEDAGAMSALLDELRIRGAGELAMAHARERAAAAAKLLHSYPDSPHRRALEEITRFAVARAY